MHVMIVITRHNRLFPTASIPVPMHTIVIIVNIPTTHRLVVFFLVLISPVAIVP